MTEQPGTSEQPQKLVVVGQSYVGLPLAIAGVEAGYDISADRSGTLAGGSPEPG